MALERPLLGDIHDDDFMARKVSMIVIYTASA